MLTISVLVLLIISPYLIRNFNIFNVITITKSSGYNLLKGNHPNTKVYCENLIELYNHTDQVSKSLPIHEKIRGIQMSDDYKIMLGWQYSFKGL